MASGSRRVAMIMGAVLAAVGGVVCSPFSSQSDDADAGGPPMPALPDATSDASTDAAADSRYAARILADSPIGYWRFDETSGIVAHDSSGHGHDGTYGASVVLGQSGLVGDGFAAKFDGSPDGGASHFVRVPETTGLEPASALSVECWVMTTSPPSGASLVSYGSTAMSPYESYDLWAAGTYIVAKGSGVNLVSPTPAPAGKHHLAAVYDGATLTLYLDAQQVAQTAASGALGNYDMVNGLGIGSTYPATRPVFEGVIDEVAIYDIALSSTQISAHYGIGLTP